MKLETGFFARGFPLIAAAAGVFPCVGSDAASRAAGVRDAHRAPTVLVSPRDKDTIATDRPLLVWKSNPDARRYEVWIDGAKVTDTVAARTAPTVHCTAPALVNGTHQWHIVGIDNANNKYPSDGDFTFVINGARPPYWAIGPFVKYGNNPVLSPQGNGWESLNAYNPGVVYDNDGKFRMLYRAEDKANLSVEGFAISDDGFTFTRNTNPVINADQPYEAGGGVEDARLIKYNGTYYAYFTAYQTVGAGGGTKLCIATSTNCTSWTKLGPHPGLQKNAAIIINPKGEPIKINGKFTMFNGSGWGGVSVWTSGNLTTWTSAGKVDMRQPSGWKDFEVCIAVADYSPAHPNDVVLFFAGTLNANGKWYYAVCEALFSKTNLLRKADQLMDCILIPQSKYPFEWVGEMGKCIFMNSIFQYDGQWWIHYGGGDRYTCVANTAVNVVAGPNFALNKAAAASSVSGSNAASNAVDGNDATRWASQGSDPQSICVDLGAKQEITRVLLFWDAAYAKSYKIEVSEDSAQWKDAYSTQIGNGDVDDIGCAPVQARYIRMNGTQQGASGGYSLREFEVFGNPKTSALGVNPPSMSPGINLWVRGGALCIETPLAGEYAFTIYTAQGKRAGKTVRRVLAGATTVTDWNDFKNLAPGLYCLAAESKGLRAGPVRLAKTR